MTGSKQPNVIQRLDTVNEYLSGSPIWKALMDGGLSLIPFVGAAVSSALNARVTRLAEERCKQFAAEARMTIGTLEEYKIDKNFLKSDEFTSLVCEILISVAKTHEQEKIKFFAYIFTNSILVKKSKTKYKEGFVKIIANLSHDHILIFRYIYNKCKDHVNDPENPSNRITVEEELEKEFPQIPKHRLLTYCHEMARYGLLYEEGIGKFGYRYHLGSHGLTGYGGEFGAFLSDPQNKDTNP